MRILAFDTTNSTLSVALLDNDRILSKNTIYESGKQSEALIPEIEKVLKENQLWYQDLDFIASTSGPGSFTGVRVGLSVARTLKIATNLPLILVESLEVLAFKYRQKSEEIFVAIDARMDEFFIGSFLAEELKMKQITESKLIKQDDIINFLPKEKFFLCGSGKELISKALSEKNIKFSMEKEEDIIEADLLGLLVYNKIHKNSESSKTTDAVYLREPKISKRKEKK
jgi:tRNA threonylcarbamoyladenosine biosynthesis protein TsaB